MSIHICIQNFEKFLLQGKFHYKAIKQNYEITLHIKLEISLSVLKYDELFQIILTEFRRRDKCFEISVSNADSIKSQGFFRIDKNFTFSNATSISL